MHASLYPVTSITGTLAIAATALCWAKPALGNYLTFDYRAWHGEPWRLATSVFPHVDVIHLAFNLYWLWVFGTCIEEYFRPLRTLGFFLLFGVAASAAEFASFGSGIGLSGIGYGLFGMLWVLSRRDRHFADAVDLPTVILFFAWFVLCFVLSALRIWNVANVAHAAGLVLGILSGVALTVHSRAGRIAAWAAVGVLTAVILATSWFAWPYINVSPHLDSDLAYFGYRELEAGRPERAVLLLKRSVEVNPNNARAWHNLGVAYYRLQRKDEAEAALQRESRIRGEER